MPNKDLRDWIEGVKAAGELKMIKGAEPKEEIGGIVDIYQRETNRPSGLGLRQLLPIGAALGAIIFFLTQPELFSWALAVVAAVSAALPKLLGVFSHFGSSPEKH